MKENKTKPDIRFKGFTEAWEQRKLGEIIEVNSGKDYKHLKSGNIPVYGTGGYMLSVNDALSFDKDAIGIGRKGTIDKPYILKSPFWTVDTLFYAIPKENYTLNFVFGIFQKIDWKSMDESTGVPSLSKATINNVRVSYPNSTEQIKIGQYFSQLDDLITLHQRECDQLKELKKSMLKKMFPRDESSIPEVRFAGFTDAWEQRKLGDICSEIGDGLHSAPTYDNNGEYYFINGNNLVNGHIEIDELETKRVSSYTFASNDKCLDEKTVLLSINGTIGNLAYYAGEKVMLGKSAAYLKVKDIKKEFLYTSLQTEMILNNFMLSLTGTTIKNLGLEAIKKTSILIPGYDEQTKISKHFNDLDNLITLHQRELEILKNLKKTCLKRMFI